jgi:hypothetical protein
VPTPLLTSAGRTLVDRGAGGFATVGGVLWAILAPPLPASARLPAPAAPILRPVVASGQTAPAGGSFDRFDIESQPSRDVWIGS